MKINQAVYGHLKRKGYKMKNISFETLVLIFKELYSVDISKKEIIKNAKKSIPIVIDNNKYLYMLISKKEIVYVGITNNTIFRIGEHIKKDKQFDSVYIIELKSNEIPKEVEYKFIVKFKPKYNSQTITNDSVVNFINENIY